MKVSLLILMIGLAGASGALAQSVPLPFDNVGGAPVAAHYVRLEGSGREKLARDTWKDAQARCQRFLGVQVALPPDGEPLIKVTQEEYYTASHLIVSTRVKSFRIEPGCGSTHWVEGEPSISVKHSGGVCDFNLKSRVAIGYGCDPSDRGGADRLVTGANAPPEQLGTDGGMDCVRTAVEAGGVRIERCIRSRPEPWASFKYGAGGPNSPGILLATRTIFLPNGEVMEDLKAVDVRENITVGSDMLDLAHTQGFTVLGMSSARRKR